MNIKQYHLVIDWKKTNPCPKKAELIKFMRVWLWHDKPEAFSSFLMFKKTIHNQFKKKTN